MRFRDFGTWLALGVAGMGTCDAVAQRDNVLILIADDLGVDKVGAYGEAPNAPPTPNIDALASRGVLFRNAWANPWCSPTRACIQTGRYSFRTGVGRPIQYVSSLPQSVMGPAELTIPELLDRAGSGYAHAMIGKWHLDDSNGGGEMSPNIAGWSHFSGTLTGFVNYYNWPRTVNGVTATSTVYATTQTVDDALAWIQSQSQPWVCCVSFNAPHRPWMAPPPGLHTQLLGGREWVPPYYAAIVEAMDTEIGRLLQTLGPELARTNVIFIGDNGTPVEATIPPFIWWQGKGTPYEGGLNVPLIVAGPAVQSPGRVDDNLVGAVDVFATVAELCGVDPAVPFVQTDSVSFVPCLSSPTATTGRSFVYAEAFEHAQATTTGFAAVRNAQYKLIARFGRPVSEPAGPRPRPQPPAQLFDLQADPFELNNLLRGPLSMEQLNNFIALRDELFRIRDTQGAFVNYGAITCVGSNGTPTISSLDVPTVGSRYTVQLQNGAMSQLALLFVGASDRRWRGFSLPVALEPLGGGSGCSLVASGEILIPAATSSTGDAALPIVVPDQSILLGASIYHTWLVTDPTASALGFTTSDGGRARLGAPLTLPRAGQ